MSIEDVFLALKFAVAYFPYQENKWRRPDTFAVLWDIYDFDSDTLGYHRADRTSPYYFSRNWAIKGFNHSDLGNSPPIVAVLNRQLLHTQRSLKGQSVEGLELSLQLAVVDNYYDKAKRGDKRQERTMHEIQADCLFIAETVIQFLLWSKSHIVTKDANSHIFYAPKPFVRSMVDQGIFDSAEYDESKTKQIQVLGNPIFRAYKVGFKDLVGYRVNFRVRLPRCAENMLSDYVYNDYGVTYDKGDNK
jgi:hypothetical protein